MRQFNDQIFWITGASSGIGREVALQLADQGNRIVVSSRREAELQTLKNECTHPDRVLICTLDLAENTSYEAVVDRVEQQLGDTVDTLIHCGGISQRSLAIDTTAEVDRRMMEVNYFGTVALSRAILPRFIERRRGHFVVITSLMGVFSSPLRSSYCAAKHALHGYFNALRAEVEKDGVSVTMVCPGFINTDISRNALVGDGSKQGTLDEATGNGMSAQECARRIIKATRRKKSEVYIGGKELLAVYLKRFFPGWLRRIMAKSKVT